MRLPSAGSRGLLRRGLAADGRLALRSPSEPGHRRSLRPNGLAAWLPGGTVVGGPALSRVFLCGRAPIRDRATASVRTQGRLCWHAVSCVADEALPWLLGGLLCPLQYAFGRGVCRKPAREGKQLLVSRGGGCMDDQAVHAPGRGQRVSGKPYTMLRLFKT